jgi:hypothetical protein
MLANNGTERAKANFVLLGIGTAALAAVLAATPHGARANLSGFGTDTTSTDFGTAASYEYPNSTTNNVFSYDNGTVTTNYEQSTTNAFNSWVPPTIVNSGGEVSDLSYRTTEGENSSVWFDAKQGVGGAWTASFVWEMPSANSPPTTVLGTGKDQNPGLGFFLVVQDNSAGTGLLTTTNGGWDGGPRGYIGNSGIAPTSSVGIGINTTTAQYGLTVAYSNASGSIKQAVTYPNAGSGAGSGNYNNTGSVNFDVYQTPINVTVSYNGADGLTFSATQATGGFNQNGTGSFSYTYTLPESVTSLLGSTTGYVGLTGGNSGAESYESISNFSFVPEPGALGLLAAGGLGMLLVKRRRTV